jgi:TRAP-type C4-dicarboxylate transport system substrate-binding protein
MPIRSLAELKGKKIAASGVAATIYQRLEAVPVAMSPTEQYEGLSRGTIDAISVPLDAIQNFKFYEAGKYFINIKTVPRVHPIVFNQNFWDSLPQDVQQAMTDAVPDLITSAEASNVTTAGVAWKEMEDAGVEIIEWSAEDVAQINKVMNEYADSWAKDMDAKGLPGSKVLADYRALYEKYAPLSPNKN